MSRTLLFSVLLSISLVHETCCQQLPRPASFGAAMEQAQSGITIKQVFPNTTADQLGLKAEDLLISVNGKSYESLAELVSFIQSWKKGDSLVLHTKRGLEQHVSHGVVQSKPQEHTDKGKVFYGAVPYSGGLLRSILVTPDDIEDPPVIYFLQGVGCASIDFTFNPNSTVKLLIDELVAHGIAVFRVEKPGMGDSESDIGCLEMDYPLEVEAFEAGLKHLKKKEGINASQLFLFGESLSSVTAASLAGKHEVRGIINWGGLHQNWFDYYMSLQVNQKKLLGWTDKAIQKNYEKLEPFFVDYLKEGLTPSQLEKRGYHQLVKRYFREDSTRSGLHHYQYFQTLAKLEPLDMYRNVSCPVLCLAGEHDIHTANRAWAAEVSKVVNQGTPGNGTWMIVPKTTHHYFEVASFEAYNKSRKSGEITEKYRAKYFNHEIAKIISEWMRRR